MTNQKIFEVQQLRYAYGDRIAVKDIDFDVRSGEIFGLLGPNGAGKTTTIHCVSGLLADWSGSMTFLGNEFRPSRLVEQRRLIGLVPQELAIYEGLTAAENLRVFGELHGLRGSALKQQIAEKLQIAGLEDRQRDLVGKFSGGMKRRLNLACGLMGDPKLIILDEPTVGVDPQSRNHLFEAFEKLRQIGKSVLYTTHYMEEAERLCDRIAIMHEGNIIASGTVAELASEAGSATSDLESIFLQLTGRSLRDE